MGNLWAAPPARRQWEAYINDAKFVAPREDDRIAQGAFSCVYKAHLDGQVVAAKQLHLLKHLRDLTAADLEKQYEPGKDLDLFQREIVMLGMLNHKNIIKFFGVTGVQKGNVRIPNYIILEYASGGTLKARPPHQGNPPLEEWLQSLRHLEGVACALDYLHNKNPAVLHGDVKPGNILLTASGEAKLAELGLAKWYDSSDANSDAGKRDYVAPEVLRNQLCTVKTDIFSFGMTAFALHGLDPKSRYNREEFEKELEKIAEQHPNCGLGKKLLACTAEAPAERPSAKELEEALHMYRQFQVELPQMKAALQDLLPRDFLYGSATTLDLDNRIITEDKTNALLFVLEEKKTLKELIISDCRLGKVSFLKLIDMLPSLPELTRLSLRGLNDNKEHEGWTSHLIAVLPRLLALQVLELQDNHLGEGVVGQLPRCLQPLQRLQYLNLNFNEIVKVNTVVAILRSLPAGCRFSYDWNEVLEDQQRRQFLRHEVDRLSEKRKQPPTPIQELREETPGGEKTLGGEAAHRFSSCEEATAHMLCRAVPEAGAEPEPFHTASPLQPVTSGWEKLELYGCQTQWKHAVFKERNTGRPSASLFQPGAKTTRMLLEDRAQRQTPRDPCRAEIQFMRRFILTDAVPESTSPKDMAHAKKTVVVLAGEEPLTGENVSRLDISLNALIVDIIPFQHPQRKPQLVLDDKTMYIDVSDDESDSDQRSGACNQHTSCLPSSSTGGSSQHPDSGLVQADGTGSPGFSVRHEPRVKLSSSIAWIPNPDRQVPPVSGSLPASKATASDPGNASTGKGSPLESDAEVSTPSHGTAASSTDPSPCEQVSSPSHGKATSSTDPSPCEQVSTPSHGTVTSSTDPSPCEQAAASDPGNASTGTGSPRESDAEVSTPSHGTATSSTDPSPCEQVPCETESEDYVYLPTPEDPEDISFPSPVHLDPVPWHFYELLNPWHLYASLRALQSSSNPEDAPGSEVQRAPADFTPTPDPFD